jgi:zinc D-Ala-D-Ala dipeptidase
VPIIPRKVYAGDVTAVPFDPADPRSDEPLVRLAEVGVAQEAYHARTDGGNWPYFGPVPGALPEIWVRWTVAGMLASVNERLAPFGVELLVLDGYRPLACQKGLWAFFYDAAARAAPEGSPALWRAQASRHVADPDKFSTANSITCPIHATGGAVDVLLRDRMSGRLCDMGNRFEDVTASVATDHFERKRLTGDIDGHDRRLAYRRLLHWAMSMEGFENDPFAFWHYDWGTQLYVKMSMALRASPATMAWYDYIAPP